ncbi:MAG: hydroxyethylthiazole kinase [Armatimonadetes bacterium]|nr:hydroxyethylthiazole kinase [Armatimonadota bacterium]
MARVCAAALDALRRSRPLVHHITTEVTSGDVANATLALGALPVMASAVEEVEEVAARADALACNLGTLTPLRAEAMVRAAGAAAARGIPVVMDPVGVGGTVLRTETAARLLAAAPGMIVRGNPAEIAALAGASAQMRGVEATGGPADPVAVVRALARSTGGVVAMTGARDYVSDGETLVAVDNGHPLLRRITGAGCMATAAVAAFAAAGTPALVAAAAALATFGLAAERAAARASGPGTFHAALFDALDALAPDDVANGARLAVLEGEMRWT